MAENMNLLDRFLRYCTNSGKRPRTISNWRYYINRIQKWVKENYGIDIFDEGQAAKCTPAIIDDWFNTTMINFAPDTKHPYILAIQKYFEYLVKYNLIPENKNPTKILPKQKKPVVFNDTLEDSDRVYTEEDIKKLMAVRMPHCSNADNLRFRAVVSMFLETGLRAFELCEITVGDIRHCKNNTIRVERKGGKYNGVLIGDAAWPYIKAYYNECRKNADDNEAFFITRNNTQYNPCSLWQFVAKRQKYAGVKTGLHNFRHTATSYVAKAGDMAIARDFAGHSNVVMTNRYTHTSIEDRLKAVNSTDMSKLLENIAEGKVEKEEPQSKPDLLELLEAAFKDFEDEDDEEENEDNEENSEDDDDFDLPDIDDEEEFDI